MKTAKISVWVTSTGRVNELISTIESWIDQCTYSNYEFVIIHSQMNDVSEKFFALEHLNGPASEEYLRGLEEKFPKVKFKIFIQTFKRLGLVYEQLLQETDKYYINIEDDMKAVADPNDHLISNIKLLQADPHLFGVRMDLRDESVFDGCPRFPETLEAAGMKYLIWRQWCSGGAQLMDAKKVRDIGGFIIDHEPDQYIQTEHDQSRKMREAQMYTGIHLSYYGVLAHIGAYGVQGGDRRHQVAAYEESASKGWSGDGSKKVPKKDRMHFARMQVNNGKP